MQGLVDLFAPLHDLWQSFEAFMAGPGSPGLFGYWIVICLMMSGFYVVIAHDNLIKKLIGLNVFQVSVFLFYILMAKVTGGTAPILAEGIPQYSNPLPHVLILTAIVVGVATTALGLALVVRIREAYDTIEDDEIQAVEEEEDS